MYSPHADYNGTDSFSFKANDGAVDSEPATVTITVNPVNDPPVADAGPDQTVIARDTVMLDGSGSSDVDEDPLSFQWSFVTVPVGSAASLSDPGLVGPTFVPDLPGTYEVQLIVNDGTVDSAPDLVIINANPRMVDVPDVVGLPRADAEGAIIGADLTIGTVATDYSDTVPEGHVISQAPIAGISLEEGSPIDLIISLGPFIPLSVSIASPNDGTEFTQGQITVTGTVSRSGAAVSVNGIAASVVENQFIAEDIPLTAGSNTISALAEEGADTAWDAITVFLGNIDLQPLQLEIISLNQNPQSLKVSGEIKVTVANNGSEDVGNPYRVVLFEDINYSGAYEAGSDNLLGEDSVDSGPSAGSAIDVSMEFTGELLFRDNIIYFFADSAGNLDEAEETNNIISSLPSGSDVSTSFLLLDDSACPDRIFLAVRTAGNWCQILNSEWRHLIHYSRFDNILHWWKTGWGTAPCLSITYAEMS